MDKGNQTSKTYSLSPQKERKTAKYAATGHKMFNPLLAILLLSLTLGCLFIISEIYAGAIVCGTAACVLAVCLYSCGKDIIYARKYEKVMLYNDRLMESYVPKHSFSDSAGPFLSQQILHMVLYKDVDMITYCEKQHLYRLYGIITERVSDITSDGKVVPVSEKQIKTLSLYDYFDDTEEMIETVACRAGVKVTRIKN